GLSDIAYTSFSADPLLFLSAFSLAFRLLLAHDSLFTRTAIFSPVRAIYEFLPAYNAFHYLRRLGTGSVQLLVLRQYSTREPCAKHGVGVHLGTRAVKYKAIAAVIVAAHFLYKRRRAAELFWSQSRQAHSSCFGGSFFGVLS